MSEPTNLSTPEESTGPRFSVLFDFIKNPKSVLKAWSQQPPHSLGILVLLMVGLELVLNHRLVHDLGAAPSAVRQFISLIFIILLGEAAVMTTAHKIGRLFYKKGNPKTVWTFFNLSLWPLLLVLPMGLVSWTVGLSSFFNGLLLFLLLGKILTDWKIILDRHYQFNRWQSALVVVALGGIAYTLVPIFMFFSILGSISEFISMLR